MPEQAPPAQAALAPTPQATPPQASAAPAPQATPPQTVLAEEPGTETVGATKDLSGDQQPPQHGGEPDSAGVAGQALVETEQPLSAATGAKDLLEVMPSEGPTSLLGGLPYLLAVSGARRKRKTVIRSFEREIHHEKRQLEVIQRELGEQTWELKPKHHTIKALMEALASLHDRREEAEAAIAGLDEQRAAEEERFNGIQQNCNGRIAEARGEADGFQVQLNDKNAQLGQLRSQLSREEKALKNLCSLRQAREAQAIKKPELAANLEQEIAALVPQIAAAEQGINNTRAEMDVLSGPVAELSARVTEARSRLQAAEGELAEARQMLERSRQQIAAERQEKEKDRAHLLEAIARRYLELGKTMDKERLPVSELKELIERANTCHDGIREREKNIQLLHAESQVYNRKAYNNGIYIVVGAGAAIFFLAVFVVLLVVLMMD